MFSHRHARHTTTTTRSPRTGGGLFSSRRHAAPLTTTHTTTTRPHRRGGLFSSSRPRRHHHTTAAPHGTATRHRQKRRTSIGDKISGALLRLKGSLTGRPGQKAAGARRMHGTDGRVVHQRRRFF